MKRRSPGQPKPTADRPPQLVTVIRAATEADLEAIVAIYNASIPGRLATADIEPVSVESRRAWLLERDVSKHPVWVSEREGRVVAWASLGKFHGRPAYAATAELSVYVDPSAQRNGLARGFVQNAIAFGWEMGLRTLVGLVFAHNAPSLALCQRFGFETWGHLPRVAELDGVERDLLILGRRLEKPHPIRERERRAI